MIQDNDVTIFGRFTKPHGVSGELLLLFDSSFDGEGRWEEGDMFVCRIDGIWVPFFVEKARKRGNRSLLVKPEGVDSQEQAARLCSCEVGLMRKGEENGEQNRRMPVSGHQWMGYTLCEAEGTVVGKVIDVDESTENILLLIDTGSQTFLFPAAAALILSADSSTRTLTVRIPSGLRDL
jgi:16S rRNA processing protein RimM